MCVCVFNDILILTHLPTVFFALQHHNRLLTTIFVCVFCCDTDSRVSLIEICERLYKVGCVYVSCLQYILKRATSNAKKRFFKSNNLHNKILCKGPFTVNFQSHFVLCLVSCSFEYHSCLKSKANPIETKRNCCNILSQNFNNVTK